MSIAQTTNAGEKLRRPHHHAAGRLQHRLHDDGRYRVPVSDERPLEAAQAIDLTRRPTETQRTAIAVRSIDARHVEEERRKGLRKD